MPAYDYDCAACGRRFEVIHGLYDERPTTCPVCGSGPVRKAISAPAIHYKGTGWAKKERSASGAPRSSGESSTDGDATKDPKPSDPKPSEPKADQKADPKTDAPATSKTPTSPGPAPAAD